MSTYEKKEKVQDDYVCIYESGKKNCTSTFKRACIKQESTISQIKEMLEPFNYDKSNYVQQNDTCKLIFIVVTRNHKDMQRIQNIVPHI